MLNSFAPQRAFYIPKGAIKIAPKGVDVVFYLSENRNGQPTALCFVGKAKRPTWHYRFASPAAREKRIADQIASTRRAEELRAERRAERSKPHNLEKGLILYTSWGYDQTNVEYYEVIDVPSPCFVVVQEIGAPLARGEESFMSGNSVPDPETRIGKPLRRKVNMQGGSPSVKINDVVTAWVWDGKERYSSWYA